MHSDANRMYLLLKRGGEMKIATHPFRSRLFSETIIMYVSNHVFCYLLYFWYIVRLLTFQLQFGWRCRHVKRSNRKEISKYCYFYFMLHEAVVSCHWRLSSSLSLVHPRYFNKRPEFTTPAQWISPRHPHLIKHFHVANKKNQQFDQRLSNDEFIYLKIWFAFCIFTKIQSEQ